MTLTYELAIWYSFVSIVVVKKFKVMTICCFILREMNSNKDFLVLGNFC